MVPNLRRERILEYLKGKDVVFLDELIKELRTSESTIRRDLQVLHEAGEISLMRGGAVRHKRDDYDEPVIRKQMVNREQKEIIAKKAAALVKEGDYIYIDSGTTTITMLKYLRDKNITIVSSSTQLIEYLPIRGAKCILLGGEVMEDLRSVVGVITEKEISMMFFDKAFIGASGYVVDENIYTYDPREARKKELVKENSKEVYVLMDASKKNKKAFSKVFACNECILITEEECIKYGKL